MPFRYFEDFKAGETIVLGRRTVTEPEIVDFARQFDPQPFHLDHEAAKHSMFGGLVASGWHSCGLLMRLLVDSILTDSSSMGSPGVEEIRWRLPVRPGDTLSGTYKVLETRASTSKPDRGIVICDCALTNDRGEVVLTMRSSGFFGRRPAAA